MLQKTALAEKMKTMERTHLRYWLRHFLFLQAVSCGVHVAG
jgi:hypothetical protein